MPNSNNLISVHANIDITTDALQMIVAMSKQITGRDEKGVYRVDTAEKVSEMITKFLDENDFESYVSKIENY